MIKKDEGISKKEIIRNYLQGFILASLTTSGIIIVFSTKIHWGWIIIGAGYWALFCGVLGIATYYYHKSHP